MSTKRVLVVDDEPAFRELVKRTLRQAGYLVDEAPDGEVALALFREHRPDLIILDIVMPTKDGLETLRGIRARDQEVPILAVSAGGLISSQDYLKPAALLGASQTLAKPFPMSELLSAVATLLKRQS
ncbi:MAG: response regulator transcription factor [Vicinamibacterales bacterium]